MDELWKASECGGALRVAWLRVEPVLRAVCAKIRAGPDFAKACGTFNSNNLLRFRLLALR